MLILYFTKSQRIHKTSKIIHTEIIEANPDIVIENNRIQKAGSRILDVAYIDQRIKFPNGCESVAAVMVLQYWGVDINANTFISKYLDMGQSPYIDENGNRVGCDPYKEFPGDPRLSTGWGCYPPVIINALDKFVDKSRYTVKDIYDISLPALCEMYVNYNIPVIIWATIDMKEPTTGISWSVIGEKKTVTWINPLHCVVLVGYDETYYYFNDSLNTKQCKYRKEDVEIAYKGLGCQAIVIYPNAILLNNNAIL